MQNISLGHLVHEAADRMMVDEEDSKSMTNVIKRGALKDEVFLVAHTVGKAMAAKASREYKEGNGFITENKKMQWSYSFLLIHILISLFSFFSVFVLEGAD